MINTIASGSDVSGTSASARLRLISPFPERELPLAWDWLMEFPERNFDDYGPRTLEEFITEMKRRAQHERTWGVLRDRELCGIIGYLPITSRLGTFHGICFQRSVWGSAPEPAVRMVLAELFASGVEKVCASFFASNTHVHAFLRKLGAQDEGLLQKQTLQHGAPLDIQQVAIFKNV